MQQEKKPQYQRMYETRSVRPYYTIPHLGIFGRPFKKMVGFEYKKIIYVTSPDMNNAAFFDIAEMNQATKYFDRFWRNRLRVKKLLLQTRKGFGEAAKMEVWGWKQNWSTKTNEELLHDARRYYTLLNKIFGTMIISQPQHVLSLEQRIDALLGERADRDEMLRAATFFSGDLPWIEEEKVIKKLHTAWGSLDRQQRVTSLKKLVDQYGWFNEVEGSKPFTAEHYRQKILSFQAHPKPKFKKIKIPKTIWNIGQLIGELGFLRFWNRYHFMHVRYHLKKILEELVRRSKKHVLEFATIEEVDRFFKGKEINLKEIALRKHGYASCLVNGYTSLYAGTAASKLQNKVKEDFTRFKELRGSIANKGRVVGRVRVVSFSASDYNTQVAQFTHGEILVTGMTRPQIVHLCRKAAAIVTDEGGITSHAAVVSREFNIPCIIGTKNATNIFKTGDIIEVNANSGIIRLVT